MSSDDYKKSHITVVANTDEQKLMSVLWICNVKLHNPQRVHIMVNSYNKHVPSRV